VFSASAVLRRRPPVPFPLLATVFWPDLTGIGSDSLHKVSLSSRRAATILLEDLPFNCSSKIT
jgi:hypothetical protein